MIAPTGGFVRDSVRIRPILQPVDIACGGERESRPWTVIKERKRVGEKERGTTSVPIDFVDTTGTVVRATVQLARGRVERESPNTDADIKSPLKLASSA